MKPQMLVNGQPVPTGSLRVSLEIRSEGEEDFALLHVISPSDDDGLGGVALNCLYAGKVNGLDALFNKPLLFGKESEEGPELRESVFWRVGYETLELMSLQILIEPSAPGTVLLTAQSTCYDRHGNFDIAVEIRGEAQAEVYPSRSYPPQSYSTT